MTKFQKALQEAYGIEPTSVHGIPTIRTEYYYSQLERISMGLIEVEYNEDVYTWDKDYIKEGVLIQGKICFTEADEFGLLPLKCGVSGYNVFSRPTTTIIANPVVGSFERTIGEDCEIVYLQSKSHSRFKSIAPILTVYSQKLANCDAAIDIGVFNSRTTYIFQASNKNVADSYKAMFDEIGQGKPAVFVDEQLGSLKLNGDDSNFYQIKGKENYVVDMIQNEKHEIMNEFLTAVGINNANMNKREREVVDEVNSNNISIRANVEVWKENVERCVERVNRMFPDANLKITFPYYEESRQLDASNKESAIGSADQTGKGGDEDDTL